MQLVTFNIGNNRYAIDTQWIMEVIPFITTTKLACPQKFIVGTANYRGTPIPVIDLGIILEDEPSRLRMSTRMLVIKYPNSNGETLPLALIVERATNIISVNEEYATDLATTLDSVQFLGKTIHDDDGMLQIIDPTRALKNSLSLAMDDC